MFFKQQGLKFVGGQFLGLGLREPLFRWCHLFFNLFITLKGIVIIVLYVFL